MIKICYAKAMPRLLKIFALVFSFLTVSFFVPQKTFASPQEFVKAVQEGNNLQWYLGGSQGMMATTADSLLIGIVGARDAQGNLISNGALEITSKLMASLYKKPASSTEYVAYLLNNSGVTKSAFAQGEGWNFLTNPKESATSPGKISSPILKLWEISRNVVYLLFIVIFVAIGFMIMFRSKLNPQTAVNIQLAIPGIIVSLILVTFSYAISGFIIDFVYLGHNLINVLFFTGTASPLHYLIAPTGFASYWDAVKNLDVISVFLAPTTVAGSPWGGIDIWSSMGNFVLKMGEWIAQVGLGVGSGATLSSSLIPLIFAFTLLGTALKIFFGLITKYVTLILSTIFSPFIFLFSAMPGRAEGVGNFLKTMLSAALSFPATAFMFFLSSYFASEVIGIQLESLPPLNKVGALAPAASALGTYNRVLEPLIALGILMATTQVPQAIDQMLGVKPGITGAATPEIGGALSKIPIIGGLLH
jgi:hypothetical protein